MSFPIKNQPWPYPQFIAHRGGGSLAPENTLAGFRVARAHGFQAAECDVKLSADQVCFLLHDDDLERTSNGQGAAAKWHMTQLAQLDAGSKYASSFAGEPLPTLANIAAYCLAQEIALNIEIKPCPQRASETGELVARIAAQLWANANTPPLLSSFEQEALHAARQAAPHLPRAWLVEAIPNNWHEVLQSLGCIALHCDYQMLTPTQVQEVKQAGYQMLCYTVNQTADAQRLLAWGVDAVCTDRLDQMLMG